LSWFGYPSHRNVQVRHWRRNKQVNNLGEFLAGCWAASYQATTCVEAYASHEFSLHMTALDRLFVPRKRTTEIALAPTTVHGFSRRNETR
jgi:hypothetical protein